MWPVASGRIGSTNGSNSWFGKCFSVRSNKAWLLQEVAPLGHLGRNVGWSESLHMDVVLRVFILEACTEVLDKFLWSRVDIHQRQGLVSGDGWHVYDKPSTFSDHDWQDSSSGHEYTCNVDSDMLPNRFFSLVQEAIGRLMHDTCIVNQNPYVTARASDCISQFRVFLDRKKEEKDGAGGE